MGLVLREVKGSKLTIQEMDGNLIFLNSGITGNTQNIDAKLNLSDFYSYSSTTNTTISGKLDTVIFASYTANTISSMSGVSYSDFNTYTSNTNTLIGTKLNISDFSLYSSSTNTLIGTKLNTSIFAAYTASTVSNVSGVTYNDFFAYTAATNTRLNSKLDTLIYTAFTNSFYSYTSTTNTSINNRLLTSTFSTFTGVTLPTSYFSQGGNSYGTSALLGTNDNQSLSFETNGLVRMSISSGGNVGVNTTPSLSRLEVYQSGGTVFNVGGATGNLLTVNDTNTGNLLTVQDVSGNTIFLTTSNSQSGFNTSAITQSAQVQIDSTVRGFLPPRMSGSQVEAIPSPAEGLLVYATNSGVTITSKGWWGYDGSTWVKLN